jgi:hypothetical protein
MVFIFSVTTFLNALTLVKFAPKEKKGGNYQPDDYVEEAPPINNPTDKHQNSINLSGVQVLSERGKPQNFLGLQDISSGEEDESQQKKFHCTDEMEDALSSVKNSNIGFPGQS